MLAYQHPFRAVAVETDAHIAWLGAFGGGEGAILIVGTGSCGYGCLQGRRFTIGGRGFQISDEKRRGHRAGGPAPHDLGL